MKFRVGEMIMLRPNFESSLLASFRAGHIYKIKRIMGAQIIVERGSNGKSDWHYEDVFLPACSLARAVYGIGED